MTARPNFSLGGAPPIEFVLPLWSSRYLHLRADPPPKSHSLDLFFFFSQKWRLGLPAESCGHSRPRNRSRVGRFLSR